MYERSAIVLERYFSNVLGYSSENNLKVNFENYCNLVERLEEFQASYTQEQTAIQDFNSVTECIKDLQKNQERLYKKSAKLEFNRNILFNNVEENPEETEKCIIKIENDIDKNNETLKGLREKFITLVNDYNEKKAYLNKSKKDRKTAEKNYNEIFKIAEKNAKNINEFNLEFARNFTGTEIKEKLVSLMIENGKGEKVPFDEEVINCAADVGLDIAQRELQCYIDMYDNIMRLFDEIDKDCIKLDKFKKRMKNTKVKLNFLFAEKEYLVQFLDYERITAVNGKRTHKKLMEEACENLKADVVQIDNLYELILREIATKSTKKGYKELYNKSYLLDIKEKEAKFKKEKNRVNPNVGTVLNSNYWRIEGIKNIYTVFYNDVTEAFGRDLDEFDIPEDDESAEESIETIVEEPEEKEVEITGIELVEQEKVNMFENSPKEENSFVPVTFDDEENEVTSSENCELNSENREFDIFSGKYNDIESKIQELEENSDENNNQESRENKSNVNNQEDDDEEEDIFKDFNLARQRREAIARGELEDIPYEDEGLAYEQEDEEESLFGNIKNVKKAKKAKINLDILEEMEEEKQRNKAKAKKTKKGIFNNLIKINSKNKKKATN